MHPGRHRPLRQAPLPRLPTLEQGRFWCVVVLKGRGFSHAARIPTLLGFSPEGLS